MAKLLLQSLRLSIKPCFQSLLTGVETCLDVGSLKGNRHQDSITAWEMQQSCHTYEGAAVTRSMWAERAPSATRNRMEMSILHSKNKRPIGHALGHLVKSHKSDTKKGQRTPKNTAVALIKE
ncbi:hypothetical protein KCU70_g204, partial [Aureobasidium melanogenum]